MATYWLVVFALLCHLHVAVAIKSEINNWNWQQLHLSHCCTKIFIWATLSSSSSKIFPLPSIFFFNLPSWLCHCFKNRYLDSIPYFFVNDDDDLCFILLSVLESLCCVSYTGDALTAAGPLLMLKGSPMISVKLWTFFLSLSAKGSTINSLIWILFPSLFLTYEVIFDEALVDSPGWPCCAAWLCVWHPFLSSQSKEETFRNGVFPNGTESVGVTCPEYIHALVKRLKVFYEVSVLTLGHQKWQER